MAIDGVRLTVNEARSLIAKALEASNVSPENAASVAHALVSAEADGQTGHGFSRVASYAAQARAGKVDGHVKPTARKARDAWIEVDARNGFAFPAIDLAIGELIEVAPKVGIACATLYRSHHCGALGTYVEKLANQGFVALMFANAPAAMAPWGGSEPVFGTNPIAFAAPRTGAPPLTIDLSLSKVARGKIMAASKAGHLIPEGWALDRDGNPTTDPKAALAGTMVPAGEAKGATLAFMVEILAATLTGANYSFEASSFFDADGPAPGVGQTIIAFSPQEANSRFFTDRIETLIGMVLAQDQVRLPGKRKLDSRAEAERNGLVVPNHIHCEISALAES